jgi:hypothetical protein
VSPARLDELRRRRAEDIAPALGALQGRADALYVGADPLLNTNRIRVSTLAPGAQPLTMRAIREYVEAGGLMSYGPNVVDQHRRAAESTNVAARTLGLHTHVIHASTERNFDAAFATLLQAHAGALPPIRSSSVSAISSPHWRSNMEFPRVITCVSSRKPVV